MPGQSYAVQAYWQHYLRSLPVAHRHHGVSADAFAFGGGGELADELAVLVLDGRKRATTSLPIEFSASGEPLPQVGSVSIILDRRLRPVAIIERTRVDKVPFGEVDAAFAATEGEGDGSLAWWRAAHRRYFGDVCRRLGGHFDDGTPVLCQTFVLVWPRNQGVSTLWP